MSDTHFRPGLSTHVTIKPKSLGDMVASHCRIALQRGTGEVWECGVYRGDTTVQLLPLCLDAGVTLRLFDTFAGRPAGSPEDAGCSNSSFTDTSREVVEARVASEIQQYAIRKWRREQGVRAPALPFGYVEGLHPDVRFHAGWVPRTFPADFTSDTFIQFAYVDMDLYAPTLAAIQHIWPRLTPGGRLVLDDCEAVHSWPGVQKAAIESGLADYWHREEVLWWVEK